MPGLLTPAFTEFLINLLSLSIIQFTVVSEKSCVTISSLKNFNSIWAWSEAKFQHMQASMKNFMMCCFIAVKIKMF